MLFHFRNKPKFFVENPWKAAILACLHITSKTRRALLALFAATLLCADHGLLQAQQTREAQKAAQERELAVEDAFSKYAAALVEGNYEDAYKYWSIDAQIGKPFGAYADEQRELKSRFGKLQTIQNLLTLMPNGVPGYPLGTIAIVKAKLKYEMDVVIVVYEFHYEGDRWVIYKSRRAFLKESSRGFPRG